MSRKIKKFKRDENQTHVLPEHKASVQGRPLTRGLPPTPRERRATRRKAALAEAEKSMRLRRERKAQKDKMPG